MLYSKRNHSLNLVPELYFLYATRFRFAYLSLTLLQADTLLYLFACASFLFLSEILLEVHRQQHASAVGCAYELWSWKRLHSFELGTSLVAPSQLFRA